MAAAVFLILSIVSFLFAAPILTFFRKEDLEVVRIGALALRCQCVVLPLQAWVIMANMLTQSIGKTRQASLLSMGRQGIFFLPLIFTLPVFLGLYGVQITQPLADLGTFLMSIPLTAPILKEIRRRMAETGALGGEVRGV